MRIVTIAVLFALLGAMLEMAAEHWVFQAHHDIAWSRSDTFLLNIATWPQVLAVWLGFTTITNPMLLALNSIGWALIGLGLGLVLRTRRPKLDDSSN